MLIRARTRSHRTGAAVREAVFHRDGPHPRRALKSSAVLYEMGDTGRASAAAGTNENDSGVKELAVEFERALDRLWIAYQPIVSWKRQDLVAYEALVRSDEPGLCTPGLLHEAAERLDRLPQLGRAIRQAVAESANEVGDALLFVNLHPSDLLDDTLFMSSDPLAPLASKVVYEITERTGLDGKDARIRGEALRKMGFRLAVDDLGVGYAGLSSIVQLQPEVVKIDMSLVRNVDSDPIKRRLISSMVDLCGSLGSWVVMEGVETSAERDALAEVGCDLLQGYLFGRPTRGFSRPVWA